MAKKKKAKKTVKKAAKKASNIQLTTKNLAVHEITVAPKAFSQKNKDLSFISLDVSIISFPVLMALSFNFLSPGSLQNPINIFFNPLGL